MSLNPRETAARNAQARRAQATVPPEDVPLDPVFPYRVVTFDPAVFGKVVDKESVESA